MRDSQAQSLEGTPHPLIEIIIVEASKLLTACVLLLCTLNSLFR